MYDYLIPFLITIHCEAFFAAAEACLATLNRNKLDFAEGFQRTLNQLVVRYLDRRNRFLALTLFGSIITLVVNSYLIGSSGLYAYPGQSSWGICAIGVAIVILYGEIIPRMIFHHHSERYAGFILPPLILLYYLLYPVHRLLAELLGEKYIPNVLFPWTRTKEDLKTLIAVQDQLSDVKASERKMIERILSFSQKEVDDIMIPLTEVCAIEKNISIEQAIHLIEEKGYSRYPIYDDRIDNVIGIIHTRDIFKATDKNDPVHKHLRAATYIPELYKVRDLMEQFRKGSANLAIVVDEYGGAVGVCTIEDIIEDIVGDIDDEYDDEEEALYSKIGPNRYQISARVDIDRIKDALKLDLPDGDYDTLGGFLLEELRRIPQKGEQVTIGKLHFSIKEATSRSIEEVYLVIE